MVTVADVATTYGLRMLVIWETSDLRSQVRVISSRMILLWDPSSGADWNQVPIVWTFALVQI